jgi:hypothetical protein
VGAVADDISVESTKLNPVFPFGADLAGTWIALTTLSDASPLPANLAGAPT